MARSGENRIRTKRKRTQGAPAGTAKAAQGNPRWFVPVMCGLMIIGLLWLVVYYLTAAQWPVPAWGNWNLAAGFAFIIAGFLMTTQWR